MTTNRIERRIKSEIKRAYKSLSESDCTSAAELKKKISALSYDLKPTLIEIRQELIAIARDYGSWSFEDFEEIDYDYLCTTPVNKLYSETLEIITAEDLLDEFGEKLDSIERKLEREWLIIRN